MTEERVNLAAIRLLHRDGDSFVHLMYRPLAGSSIGEGLGLRPVEELPGGFCSVADLEREFEQTNLFYKLDIEGFFSINGFGLKDGRRPFRRKETQLRRLNAAHVDCDGELSWPDAVAALLKLQEEGILPPISLFGHTGNRGIWAYWLLDDDGLPPTAREGNRRLLQRCNSELQRRINHHAARLAADPQSTDLARVCRIDGTRHRYTDDRARYYQAFNGDGSAIVHGLDEFAAALGLDRPIYKAKRTGKKPRHSTGHVARRQKYLDEFAVLLAGRDGRFRAGARNGAAFVYAHLLALNGWSDDASLREVVRFGQFDCSPPLPVGDCEAHARSTLEHRRAGGRQMRNCTMAERLGVTTDEADALGLESLRPDFQRAQPKGQKAITAARRAAVAEELAKLGGVPLGREIHRRLVAAGMECSHESVYRDLERMGFPRRATFAAEERDMWDRLFAEPVN